MVMLFPTLCIDNFFPNPDKILKLAQSLEFNRVDAIPGYRSAPLHEIDYELYNHVNLKIAAALYPNNIHTLQFDGVSMFQLTKSNLYDGWVHRDDDGAVLTAIIYLSDCDSGTSIYHKKNPYWTHGREGNMGKHEYFGAYENYTESDLEKVRESRSRNNEPFEETMSFKGRFNRMICFDAKHFHAAQVLDESDDRLILISFIREISLADTAIFYHVPTVHSL